MTSITPNMITVRSLKGSFETAYSVSIWVKDHPEYAAARAVLTRVEKGAWKVQVKEFETGKVLAETILPWTPGWVKIQEAIAEALNA